MEVEAIFRIAGVGLLTAVINIILKKSDKDEIATFVTLAGLIIVLVMVLDGRVPDEGACVELGIAYALGKPCYGIRTDVRAAERGLDINPMLTGCFIKIFSAEDRTDAFKALSAYIAEKGL